MDMLHAPENMMLQKSQIWDEIVKNRQRFYTKNLNWKAVSHALRAAYQTKEILTENTINFPLRTADFLIKVKQGKLDYLSEVGPVLEMLMEEVENLALTSSLPERVERKFWDLFICEKLERELF